MLAVNIGRMAKTRAWYRSESSAWALSVGFLRRSLTHYVGSHDWFQHAWPSLSTFQRKQLLRTSFLQATCK